MHCSVTPLPRTRSIRQTLARHCVEDIGTVNEPRRQKTRYVSSDVNKLSQVESSGSFPEILKQLSNATLAITCSAVALSRVLRTALVPYGNMEYSTPHSSETSQVMTMKLCTFDYVRETNTCAKFGWNPPARGRSTHT